MCIAPVALDGLVACAVERRVSSLDDLGVGGGP